MNFTTMSIYVIIMLHIVFCDSNTTNNKTIKMKTPRVLKANLV